MQLNLARKGRTKVKIVDELGEGAQGKVYRVKNGTESYALKVYDQEDEFAVAAQRRARKIGELIKTPQTGALIRGWAIDAGEDVEHNPVMLYNLFNHRSIEDYHDAYQAPKNHRVRERMAVGLTAGIVEIHRNNIIHADLAPINVLYSQRGEVAIIDFDGSGYKPKNKSEYLEPIVKGHGQFPGWIAPYELINSNADFHTDIWWVSSILMKILSNHSPYFFLRVADPKSLEELDSLIDDPTLWPPKYQTIKKHSKVQPALTPKRIERVREVLNKTIATGTLAKVFLNYHEPENRPTAIKLWSSFRGRVFR